MLQVTSVKIRRAEGPIALCNGWHTFTGPNAEEQGNQYLLEISQTAPDTGGYDKTDVNIVFSNGQTWEARFDVKHFTCEDSDTNIRQHVKNFLYYQLNPSAIPWIRRERNPVRRQEYCDSILKTWSPEERKEAQGLLDLL